MQEIRTIKEMIKRIEAYDNPSHFQQGYLSALRWVMEYTEEVKQD